MSRIATGGKKPKYPWEIHIQQGNAYMLKELYSQAQAAYIRGMEASESQLEMQKQINPIAIHGFVISCRNLAKVYCIRDLQIEAERLLLKAYTKALKLMKIEHLSIRYRTEAYRAFHAAFAELIDFYNNSESEEKIAETIEQSKLHIQIFFQEVNLKTYKSSLSSLN
ncbi:MAG: hypothetical protein AAF349_04640 [Cyanobacteria bacterium P01_A01_bin.68]